MSCVLKLEGEEDPSEFDPYLFDGITYNLSPMFRKATGRRFADMKGLTGQEAFLILRKGLAMLEAFPDEFRELNPENGWGDYDGLVRVMRKAVDTAREHPDAVVMFYG
jgi:hypothetical protein